MTSLIFLNNDEHANGNDDDNHDDDNHDDDDDDDDVCFDKAFTADIDKNVIDFPCIAFLYVLDPHNTPFTCCVGAGNNTSPGRSQF